MGAIEPPSAEHPEISLDFLRGELTMAFERVWETSLCLPLRPLEEEPVEIDTFPWLGSVAWIGGSWTGNVRLGLDRNLAAIITAKLLELESPMSDQIHDALRELANMTAGNLKAALPGRCGLATPGHFEIKSLHCIKEEFSPVMLRWYESDGLLLFLAASALHHTDQ